MSIIQAAGSGEVSTGFYSHLLDQSLKFDDGLSQRLTRTPASAGNRRTFTFSCWVKRSLTSSGDHVLYSAGADAQNRFQIWIDSSDRLAVYQNTSNSDQIYVYTTAKFRDPSAWYNVVVTVDTTDGTAGNRIVLSVNGTSYAYTSTTTPTQNLDTHMNNTVAHAIGGSSYSAVSLLDGYIAEVNAIDGAALTAASFGETKNGIWIPKDTSGLTFGTNGFHLTFKDDVVSEGFNTVTYTGTGAAQSVSGVGFEPSLIWVKRRDSSSYGNKLYDAVRGFSQELTVDATDGEYNLAGRVTGHSDGFDLGTYAGVNESGGSLVAWCWEAGGTPTADNSAGAGATPTAGSVKIDGSNLGSALAGTIPATRISANTARGFSIVTFEGTSTAGSVAHGLSSAPKWVIAKNRDSTTEWPVYHDSANSGGGSYLRLDTTNANASTSIIWTDSPSSTVVNIGTYEYVNRDSMVLYCWAEVSGYSKFGSYSGSGSSGKSVTGLGFKPAFLMIKRTDSAGSWRIYDNTRDVVDPRNLLLFPSDSSAEATSSTYDLDFDSDGFTLDGTNAASNNGSGTYIYMAFADTREAAFFKDVSSNGNHFTPVNLDYRDSVPDVPTNNFATFNSLAVTTSKTLSEGNLKVVTPSSGYGSTFATFAIPSSGKWYFEGLLQAGTKALIGLSSYDATKTYFWSESGVTSLGYYAENGTLYGSQDSGTSYGASYSAGDIIGVAVNADDNEVTFYKNNSTQGTDSFTPDGLFPMFNDFGNAATATWVANFGQDSSFAGNKSTANSNADGNGHGSFAYAPPSGFLALCSQNLADVDIIDGTDHFNTVLWTGNSSTSRAISFGHQTGLAWVKNRTGYHHRWADVVRGANKHLYSSLTNAEGTDTTEIIGFDSDGITVGNSVAVNGSAANPIVGWSWMADTAFSNDASATGVGTIDSEGQVNATAGFAIIKYTGTRGSDGGETGTPTTIAHGLGKKPTMVITKRRDGTGSWNVWHQGYQPDATYLNYQLKLESTDASNNAGWQRTDTGFSTTVFCPARYSYDDVSGADYIAYVFTDTEGYCKTGSYVGNGNADGPFVFTGFRVSFLLVRRADGVSHWNLFDDVRHPSNPNDARLYANLSNAEDNPSSYVVDLLSNGFKPRHTGSDLNTSGGTYIYLAFADQPFKFSNAR